MDTSSFFFQPIQSALAGIPAAAAGAIAQGVSSLASGLPGLGGVTFPGTLTPDNSTADNSNSPLKDFLADITSNGLSWGNRFYVTFVPPASISDLIAEKGTKRNDVLDAQRLMMRCDTAELPSHAFNFSETRHFAPSFRSPIASSYTDLSLNFILSGNMQEKYFFDFWKYTIIDDSNMVAYYNDIVTDIFVTVFTNQNQPVYGIKFVDAWPTSTSPIAISWQDQEYLRLGVNFAYNYWEPVAYAEPQWLGSGQDIGVATSDSAAFFQNFLNGVLPSIPGGNKFLAYSRMNSSQLLRTGVGLIGNTLKNNTKNPVTQTILTSGINSILKTGFGG